MLAHSSLFSGRNPGRGQQPAAKAPAQKSATRAEVGDIGEQRTGRYLDSIRRQRLLLVDFVHQMPKGADLHNHLSGAMYRGELYQLRRPE